MFLLIIYTMWLKIRIHILVLVLWGLGTTVLAEAQGDLLAPFSRQIELKEALWNLAAFVPGQNGSTSLNRTLEVEGVSGLPPVKINLNFAAPLDLWPQSLTLDFVAEKSENKSVIFTITDHQPFGGPNLSLSGLDRQGDSRSAPNIMLDIITSLNQRLLAGRNKLGPVKWREIAPGFQLARAKLLYGVRMGNNDLFLARFDPNLYAFKPYHENEFPNEPQVDIHGWSQRLKQAPALINGGQYYPDRSYMGTITRQGQILAPKPHPQWKGYLVSTPTTNAPPNAPKAAIIDQNHPGTLQPVHYLNSFQSYMLLDEKGTIRVRNTHNLAGRTAIAQDKQGRLILIMTPGAISLYDLALALKYSNLNLIRVIGLDGGFEAQLLIKENERPFISGGHFSITKKQAIYLPGFYQSLPMVLAIEPF